MEMTQTDVTDFKIVWNNFAINTMCPFCSDRTEPSINFQVQTKEGDAICETCLIEKATDLAEVLYAYFAYKHPEDFMAKEFLKSIEDQKLINASKPKSVSSFALAEIQEATDAVMLSTAISDSGNKIKRYLVTKKWLLSNQKEVAEKLENYSSVSYNELAISERATLNTLYLKARSDGAVIVESEDM